MIILKKEYINILIVIVVILLIYLIFIGIRDKDNPEEGEAITENEGEEVEIMPNYENSKFKEIYLAGGCFWGIEAYFDKILGVEFAESGYANGETEDTSYKRIESTGHAETVKVIYNPEVVNLDSILEYYFRVIDPTIL